MTFVSLQHGTERNKYPTIPFSSCRLAQRSWIPSSTWIARSWGFSTRAPSMQLVSWQKGSYSEIHLATWLLFQFIYVSYSHGTGGVPMAPGSCIEAASWFSFRRSWLELMRADHFAETSGTLLGKTMYIFISYIDIYIYTYNIHG